MSPSGNATHHLGIVLVAVSAIAWSTAGIFTKGIAADVWIILFWRGLFSAAFIALYVAWRDRATTLACFGAMGLPGWAIATIGTIATVAYLSSFKFTAVTNVVVIYATAPFVAAAIAWLAGRERTKRSTLFAAAAALVGVIIMMSGSLGTPNLTGDLLAVVMTIFMAIMLVLIRRFPTSPSVPAMALSSLQITVIACFLVDPFAVSVAELWWLVAFGLVQAGAVILLTEGTRLIPAPQAALIGSLDVPLAPIWAWLILAELPPVATFVGGAIVLAAVALHMRRDWQRQPLPLRARQN